MDRQGSSVSRRTFVQQTGTLVGSLAAAATLRRPSCAAAAASPPGPTMPLATLGRTGVQVSRLGIGCAHFQRPHVRIDDVTAVLHRAVELGVNYFDTAPNYGDEPHVSEQKMGPAVREIRDRIFLVTKTEEPTYEGTWRLLRQSLKRLQTDHLDLVHLHNLGVVGRFPNLQFTFSRQGAFGALEEAKKQGVVRFIGASGHLFPARFHAALDTGGIDVLMNAVNYVVQHVYNFENRIWSRARHQNIGLVAMKVLGGAGPGGTGFRLPTDAYESALRYALTIPGLACAVVGIENTTELEQAVATTARFKPLTTDEAHTLAQRGLAMAAEGDWPQVYGQPVD